MKIGRSGYRRTPWWCWGVALLAAVAVLPGAAMVISADEGPKVPYQAISQGLVAYPLDANAAPANSGLVPAFRLSATRRRRIRFTIQDLFRERRAFQDSRGGWLERASRQGEPSTTRKTLHGQRGRRSTQTPAARTGAWLKDSDDLVVGATDAGHKRAADALDVLRKYGTSNQIAIETRFLTIGDKEFQEVLPESTMSPLNVDEAGLANSDAVQPASFDRPLGSHEGTHVARAQLLIEKDSPMRFRIVDKEQGEKLIDRCQADKRSNMIQAPKVTVFNGQTALVSDTSQSPFVVGVIPVVGPFATAYQPQIRVVSEGTMLQLRPVADRSGAVHLDFAATFSKIQEVETATFNRTPTDGTTIQIPKVATIRLEGGAALKPGQWLLLSGSDITDQMTDDQG